MRSEVIAEVTKLRNQEIGQAQQELQQQLQQQVHWNLPMIRTHYMLQQTCVQAVACQLSVREREREFFFLNLFWTVPYPCLRQRNVVSVLLQLLHA